MVDEGDAGARVALAVGAAAIVLGVVAVVARTGRLGYAVDDAYIHLAIAETLADHGTFGIEAGRFESASSSPLWTAVLALGGLLPVPGTWLPLALAGPSGLVAAWLLGRSSDGPVDSLYERLAVAATPVAAGIAPLVLTGMEHATHVVVVLLLVRTTWAGGDVRSSRVVALLAVGTGLRLETAFVAVGLVAVVLRRRAPRSVLVGRSVAVLLPVGAVMSAIAAANAVFGQHLVPNSILAKAATGRTLSELPSDVAGRLTADPLLLAALVAMVVVANPLRVRTATSDAAVVVLVATVLHLLLADVGWFDRYQGYLVASAIAVCVRAVGSVSPGSRRRALGIALVLAAAPRAALLVDTPRAAEDIFRDQEQVARFLVTERPGRAVALNDIGFPAFLGAGPIIDLYGLADQELLDLRRSGRLDARTTEEVLRSRGAQLMIVYEVPFAALVPTRWVVVERWCFPDPYVLSDDCILFAAEPAVAEEVRAQLSDFARVLPGSVLRRPAADEGG